MKRINVMVSTQAKEVLGLWKKHMGVTTLDEAMDALLIAFSEGPGFYDAAQKRATAIRKEMANHVDDLTED